MQGLPWINLALPFVFAAVIAVIGLWGARKVRRDIFKLAGKEEEEDEPE